eukprot:TRINITY_DN7432_c0_g1_i1.p1 TRINITY_DN7432_c0_g1~~TRINITY_DN7432_c0_g1_i1.p1  ORF type:complete len:146 (+),score=53.98 TRINITY_DN7432_c0_g1_i1:63-500(+)
MATAEGDASKDEALKDVPDNSHAVDMEMSDVEGGDETPAAPAPAPKAKAKAKPRNDFMIRFGSAVTQHRRSFAFGLVLFIVGVVLHGLAFGCLAHCKSKSHAAIFLIPGVMFAMPGFYSLLTFVQYARRVPGYDPRTLTDKFHTV